MTEFAGRTNPASASVRVTLVGIIFLSLRQVELAAAEVRVGVRSPPFTGDRRKMGIKT